MIVIIMILLLLLLLLLNNNNNSNNNNNNINNKRMNKMKIFMEVLIGKTEKRGNLGINKINSLINFKVT